MRLATRVLVDAIRRQAEAQGGFAAILARGDPDAGDLAIVLLDRAGGCRLLVWMPGTDGGGGWEDQLAGIDSDRKAESLRGWQVRARARDPDLWILELDVANPERLIATLPERS